MTSLCVFFFLTLASSRFPASADNETPGIRSEAELLHLQTLLWSYVLKEVDTNQDESINKLEAKRWLVSAHDDRRRTQLEQQFACHTRSTGAEQVVSKESLFGDDVDLQTANEKRFSAADVDGDGVLTKQEFQSFLFPDRRILALEFIDLLAANGRRSVSQVSLTGSQGELIRRLNVRVSLQLCLRPCIHANILLGMWSRMKRSTSIVIRLWM